MYFAVYRLPPVVPDRFIKTKQRQRPKPKLKLKGAPHSHPKKVAKGAGEEPHKYGGANRLTPSFPNTSNPSPTKTSCSSSSSFSSCSCSVVYERRRPPLPDLVCNPYFFFSPALGLCCGCVGPEHLKCWECFDL